MTSKSGKRVNKIAPQVCASASSAEGEDADGHTCTKGTNAFKGAALALLLSCPGVQDCNVKARNRWRLFLMLPVVHTPLHSRNTPTHVHKYWQYIANLNSELMAVLLE